MMRSAVNAAVWFGDDGDGFDGLYDGWWDYGDAWDYGYYNYEGDKVMEMLMDITIGKLWYYGSKIKSGCCLRIWNSLVMGSFAWIRNHLQASWHHQFLLIQHPPNAWTKSRVIINTNHISNITISNHCLYCVWVCDCVVWICDDCALCHTVCAFWKYWDVAR